MDTVSDGNNERIVFGELLLPRVREGVTVMSEHSEDVPVKDCLFEDLFQNTAAQDDRFCLVSLCEASCNARQVPSRKWAWFILNG